MYSDHSENDDFQNLSKNTDQQPKHGSNIPGSVSLLSDGVLWLSSSEWNTRLDFVHVMIFLKSHILAHSENKGFQNFSDQQPKHGTPLA